MLRLTPRQVRRLLPRLQQGGHAALVQGLRGRPSHHRKDAKPRRQVVRLDRKEFHDFDPTLAAPKRAERGLEVSPDTVRRWLLAEGLGQRQRRRDPQRRRRPRRCCFGELVPMDTSIHDWTQGRGEERVLRHRIEDATSRLRARFYDADTVLDPRDLLRRWLQAFGRPWALDTDRHRVFVVQDKGQALPDVPTPFGCALRPLDSEWIRARRRQAQGRVERTLGTAQDRVVKEMRRAQVKTIGQAKALLDEELLVQHNRMFTVPPRQTGEAHRAVGSAFNEAAIWSLQEQRTAAPDYTIRLENRHYQLDKPIYPGERAGQVVIEGRLDGSMAIRFGEHYLKYHEIASTPEGEKEKAISSKEAESSGVQPAGGRRGHPSAEPSPPDGEAEDTKKGPYRPGADPPWRRGFRGKRKD